jgi:hypothetical protein
MSTITPVRLVIISAGVPLAVMAAAAGLAHADPPSAGDSCPQLHATTQDDEGRSLVCEHTLTGGHSLVWQYGSSDQ